MLRIVAHVEQIVNANALENAQAVFQAIISQVIPAHRALQSLKTALHVQMELVAPVAIQAIFS
jgi:hypothetical protein